MATGPGQTALAKGEIVTSILLIFVVPQFEELFAGFGADLPAFTQMVIMLSEWMQANWWIVLIAIGASIYGFRRPRLIWRLGCPER